MSLKVWFKTTKKISFNVIFCFSVNKSMGMEKVNKKLVNAKCLKENGNMKTP